MKDLPFLKTPVNLSLALRRLFPKDQATAMSPCSVPTLTSPISSPHHHHRSRSTTRLPPLDGSFTSRGLEEGVILSGGSFSRLRLRDALMASRSNSESSGPLSLVRATAAGRSATTGGNKPAAVSSNPLYDKNSFKN